MDIEHITVAERKFITQLAEPRARREARLFVAEGWRCISELLPAFRCKLLTATDRWFDENGARLRASAPENLRLLKARPDEIERMSSLRTPQGVLAVFHMPEQTPEEPTADTLYIALDRVQDPGNLGTIVRMADWFGIHRIYASPETADVFNQKVVQSTMGALARVTVQYTSLLPLLQEASSRNIMVYGTFLDGTDLYSAELTPGGIIVMGNEGRGVSPEVAQCCTRRLMIPPFPADARTVESLNVSVATAVTVAEFRRRSQVIKKIR